MFKTLGIAILASALALGATAAPARADSGETARAIIGIATLAIIAGAIAKKSHGKTEVHRADPPRYYYPPPRDRDDYRYKPYHKDRYDRRVLPAACALPLRDTRGGSRMVLSEDCLKNVTDVRRLPRECAFDVRVRHRTQTVYAQRCLERDGYRIAARR